MENCRRLTQKMENCSFAELTYFWKDLWVLLVESTNLPLLGHSPHQSHRTANDTYLTVAAWAIIHGCLWLILNTIKHISTNPPTLYDMGFNVNRHSMKVVSRFTFSHIGSTSRVTNASWWLMHLRDDIRQLETWEALGEMPGSECGCCLLIGWRREDREDSWKSQMILKDWFRIHWKLGWWFSFQTGLKFPHLYIHSLCVCMVYLQNSVGGKCR